MPTFEKAVHTLALVTCPVREGITVRAQHRSVDLGLNECGRQSNSLSAIVLHGVREPKTTTMSLSGSH